MADQRIEHFYAQIDLLTHTHHLLLLHTSVELVFLILLLLHFLFGVALDAI